MSGDDDDDDDDGEGGDVGDDDDDDLFRLRLTALLCLHRWAFSSHLQQLNSD